MFDGLPSSTKALYVAPVDVINWADRIRPHIAKMASDSGGRYETSDLFADLATGRMILWLAVDGSDVLCVLIGQLHIFPRKRVMRMIALSGKRPQKWAWMLKLVEAHARDHFGCTLMESLHKPRFFALLRGFTTTHWLSEKPL